MDIFYAEVWAVLSFWELGFLRFGVFGGEERGREEN